jgi:hypothetical protein
VDHHPPLVDNGGSVDQIRDLLSIFGDPDLLAPVDRTIVEAFLSEALGAFVGPFLVHPIAVISFHPPKGVAKVAVHLHDPEIPAYDRDIGGHMLEEGMELLSASVELSLPLPDPLAGESEGI